MMFQANFNQKVDNAGKTPLFQRRKNNRICPSSMVKYDSFQLHLHFDWNLRANEIKNA